MQIVRSSISPLLLMLFVSSNRFFSLKISRGFPIEIIVNEQKVDMLTRISTFKMILTESDEIDIDLFSMVHIADSQYYDNIKRLCSQYDIVLYELITSDRNTLKNNFKRSLTRPLYSIDSSNLAAQFSLQTQLDGLDLQKSGWYIADIDSERLQLLENPRRALTSAKFFLSIVGGRSNGRNFLSRFFLSDAPLITSFRILSWLLPCPELSCLMLDWSRMSPQAGGLPIVIEPIIDCVLAGKFNDARKLAFAQQLVSGIPDSGSWGGEARSDVDIRVSARNAECMRVLDGFIEEFSQCWRVLKDAGDQTPKKARVGILYGAYHIADLSQRLQDAGFDPVVRSVPTLKSSTARNVSFANFKGESSQLCAWSISRPQRPTTTGVVSAVGMRYLFVGLLTAVYLLFGAVDWILLVNLVVKTFAVALLDPLKQSSNAIVVDAMSSALSYLYSSDDTISYVASEGERSFLPLQGIFALLYTTAYVQRHHAILRSISAVGVQWNQGLFEDDVGDPDA